MRILLAFVDAGMGPRNQMRALSAAIQALAPEANVELLDLVEADTSGSLKRSISMMQDWRYRVACSKPMSIPWRIRRKALMWQWQRSERQLHQQLLPRVRAARPDVVVAGTGAARGMAQLREKGLVRTPLVNALADHVIRGSDVLQPCELYTAGSVAAARQLQGLGVPSERIAVTGIPIDPVYVSGLSGDAILTSLELQDEERPVILQMHSATEDESRERLSRLLEVGVPSDIIVVGAADPDSLAAHIEKKKHSHRVRILGHSERIPELLAAADVVVTKPGGLTTAQAMAAGCALILRDPLPGYEQGNLEYLLCTGCSVRVHEEATLPVEVSALLSDVGRLRSLQEAARHAAYPAAARDAAACAIEVARYNGVRSAGRASAGGSGSAPTSGPGYGPLAACKATGR